MGKAKDIVILTTVLILVSFAIGYLLSQEGYFNSEKEYEHSKTQDEIKSQSNEYLEIIGEKEVKSNRVIISDKFVGDFDPNGQVVVLDSTGSAYIVHEGVILTSDDVLIENREETYKVTRLNEPAKTVSSSN